MAVVMEAFDSCFLDRAVHLLNLTIGPGVIGFRQAMLDPLGLAETINGLYKTELIYRQGAWKNREAVEPATLKWVDWFNNRRILSHIGNIPPAEAEARFYAQQKSHALAA